MDGIQGIEEIKRKNHLIDIIVMTIHEDNELVFKALCAGAVGYLTKGADYRHVIEALDEVKNGGSPMSSKIARMVTKSFQRNYFSPLTRRETEVLGLISQGKSYQVISDELFVSVETIKSHIYNIFQKLQVSNKTEAVYRAREDKLI